MPNIGPLEIVVVLAVVLLIFGPKRLPGAGRALGQSMREFKDSISGSGKTDELPEAQTAPTPSESEQPAAQPAKSHDAPSSDTSDSGDAGGASGTGSSGSVG